MSFLSMLGLADATITQVDHFDPEMERPTASRVSFGKGAHANFVTVYYPKDSFGERSVELLHSSDARDKEVFKKEIFLEHVKPYLRVSD